MKVLVIGSGGREHALVWKLKQSKKVDKIFCAPGNGGISLHAKCVNIQADNIKALVDFAQRNKIHLTVVGPERASLSVTETRVKVLSPSTGRSTVVVQ